MYGLFNYIPSTTEPVTVEQARKHIELPATYTRHDTQLKSLIVTARERAEIMTGRQIGTATWDLYLDYFPCTTQPIWLPRPPLQSVTSITYVDTAGDSQTWSSASYSYSTKREPGVVRPIFGGSYPTARTQLDSVRIRYVCGYTGTSCPAGIRHAILLLVGHWFEQRAEVNVGNIVNEIPVAAADLLLQYKIGDEFINYGVSEYAEAV